MGKRSVEVRRVHQWWPAALKRTALEVAGTRGLTALTIEAVADLLGDLGYDLPLDGRGIKTPLVGKLPGRATTIEVQRAVEALVAAAGLPEDHPAVVTLRDVAGRV